MGAPPSLVTHREYARSTELIHDAGLARVGVSDQSHHWQTQLIPYRRNKVIAKERERRSEGEKTESGGKMERGEREDKF